MVAIYPGTFDPVTNGHMDIIKRASQLVDKLVVGLLVNNAKTPLFTLEERTNQLETIISNHHFENVYVDSFSGLLVDFARIHQANIIFRGLRTGFISEFDSQMTLANRKLADEIETLFLFANPDTIHISSSLVKEIAKFGGNIDDMVPSEIKISVFNKLSNRRNS